jgi:acyl-homoserine lactone acylase PvdQ
MRQTLVMSAPGKVDEMVIAVEGGAPLNSDQNLALAKAVVDAFKTIKQKFGKAVPRYGEVYRAARGQFETGASGGYIVAGINLKSHLVIGEGDRKMSVRISPHASRYREDNSTGRQLMTDGTRIPFVVSFTAPIQSFGMTAFGSSNDETSPFYANQLPFAAGKNLKPNYFEFSQLEGNIASTTVLTNSTQP